MFSKISVKALALLTAAAGLAVPLCVAGWQYASAPSGDVRSLLLWGAVSTVAAYCLVVVPLAVVLVRKVTRPVAEIQQRVEKILDGDYSVCFACDGGDELAEMRLALDSLLSRLKYNLGFAQGVLKGIDTPFVVVDNDEVLTYTNPSLISLLEQTGKPEDHYGQNVALFFYGDASRRTVLRDSLEHHTVTSREVDLTTRKGNTRRIQIHASPLFDLSGGLMGALCIYQDLTDLRAREAEIVSKNESIAAAVKSSETVSLTVSEIAGSVDQLIMQSARDAETQTERTVESASAMEQMNVAVLDVARSASAAAEQAGIACDKARQGAGVVEEAMNAIDEVARLAEGLKVSMGDLGRQAEGIGQVMTVISDIADQTNLLALNAAIEAARAGDAGRGFAVVADEVRKLAEKTMQATSEVGAAITSIQAGTRNNVQNVEASVLAVQRSRELSSASGDSLREIVDLVIRTTDQVQAIATASEEQSSTSEHISQAVDEVRIISENSARSLAEAAGMVHKLSAKAGELQRIISTVASS
ncbi:methyl-accepting chemotaxis sensory transducer with Pas/Pac sensor [Oleidesulfovibrio alaskensis G20]|jgi:methyl-accepting chemotaxis protein|uniref:Methyl-accepting chemotaxis sensory transducer with Pas/Pac sensor n=1 Tax=Oleidesulfovibrio alaskensis (strain ATCC BAA-1058 / DSM 17464 / G20) TaxID=207559 RepID=Q30WS8_OLEA2|nr:methyl-accepting chemotaxis protein [Oleidesulfovibrio alaskensis]ABB39868.1 methyl-accepting chemotaxis sensory transducer with Pas/Pac sensor [Oleidesulfovibrio alaskensis G20]MBG0773587.1 methyl-accepting chemotaxis protein [Oleidesulfovibrio alaskensis]MBL3582078.1 methyl-accepting chemotaxis protein [Oleidesulfovibrio alaskensis]